MEETLEQVKDRVDNWILIEKYKPKTLDEVILPDDLPKEKFQEYLDRKEIPNLLFYSRSAGTGKSTVARILSESIGASVLRLNASKDRGIDTVRYKVDNFCMTESMGIRIIVFEEFDNVTFDAQKALLDLIEEHIDTVRFIMTCNNPNKVIEPIKSRTQQFKFGDLDSLKVFRRVIEILSKEKIEYDKKNVANIIKYYKSDMRSILQTIQKLTVDKKLGDFAPDSDNYRMIMTCIKEKDIFTARKLINEKNLNGEEVLKYIYRNVTELSEKNWPEVVCDLSEGLYRMKMGVDPEIGLVSTLIYIMNSLNNHG